jgi:adenylyl-sulfate kinase
MKPTVVWITGLSGAGKTTVANALYQFYKNGGYKVGLLDGDVVRASLEVPLGYTLQDREKFVNTVTYMASNMLSFQKAEIVIVALISPLRSMRASARHIIETYCDGRFIEVFLDTPLEICEERDPKGLYRKARAGEIKEFTGIDSPYEAPEFPEVRIHPKSTLFGTMTLERSIKIIKDIVDNRSVL